MNTYMSVLEIFFEFGNRRRRPAALDKNKDERKQHNHCQHRHFSSAINTIQQLQYPGRGFNQHQRPQRKIVQNSMDVDLSFTQQGQPHVQQQSVPFFQHQHQQHQSIVGMIVPKGPVRTDFVPADATGTRYTLALNSQSGDLPWPLRLVNELVFFITNPSLMSKETGLLIYWQLRLPNGQGESGFELLGALWPSTKPSDTFRTGWAEHEQFVGLEQQQQQGASIVIGVSVEPISTIQNITGVDGNIMSQPWGGNINSVGMMMMPPTAGPFMNMPSAAAAAGNTVGNHASNKTSAHKIAEDLYNYMMSFDTGGATGNQTMVVPANIFDRWWSRFEAKLKLDPNFFLKNSV